MPGLIKFAREYWVILAFATQIVFNYAGFVAFQEMTMKDIDEIAGRVDKLEIQSVTDALTISQINSRLTGIETSLLYIRDELRASYR